VKPHAYCNDGGPRRLQDLYVPGSAWAGDVETLQPSKVDILVGPAQNYSISAKPSFGDLATASSMRFNTRSSMGFTR
jgi:hypothetical protein